MSAQSESLPGHYRKVLRFVRRRVGSLEDAEDLTQEVFAKAVVSLEHGGSDAPELAWLYTVARRRIVDEARRSARSRMVSLELVAEPAAGEARYGSEVAQALDATLSTMPEGQRHVVLGRLVQGLSFVELALELGTTEEACRMRFMRGLQHMRDEFSKEGLKP